MLSTWGATYGKEGACKTLGCQWIPRSLWTPDATHLVSSAEVMPTGGTLKISTWRDVPLLSFLEAEKENLFSGCRALQGLVGIWENQSFWKEIKQDSQVSGIIALSHLGAFCQMTPGKSQSNERQAPSPRKTRFWGTRREAILGGGRSGQRKPQLTWIITAHLRGTFHLVLSKPFTTSQLIFSTSTTPSAPPLKGVITVLLWARQLRG